MYDNVKQSLMFFQGIHTIVALKKRYLQLAVKHHPDAGGNTRIMQHINEEYRRRKDEILGNDGGLNQLGKGDTVFVNGTECLVVDLYRNTFEVQAKGRERRAIFDKYSGRCITNPKFKATKVRS